MRIERTDPAELWSRTSAQDLARVGEIAARMDAGHLAASLDMALASLREATQADACEFFLADPTGQEVFLVAHHGPDLDAFSQRIRFAGREGFPGITLQTGASLISESLESEPDFVRSRVKSLHYHTAVCVPIHGGGAGVDGCLFLAWKRPPADLRNAATLAVLASRPLGTLVEAAHARARANGVRRQLLRSGRVEEFAGHLRALTGADGAAVLYGGAEVDGPGAAEQARRRRDRCPAFCLQRVQVLGGREGWPAECVENGCTARGRYCVPLVVDGTVRAVVTAVFRERAPSPLGRGLPAALWLAEGLALSDEAARQRVEAGPRPESGARLQVRCFGGFEISVEGRPVRRADLRREKACELLALLVAAGGRPTPGERLMEQLWPDAPPAAARNRFHVTLAALRAAIEPEAGDRWHHVRRDGTRYYLEPRAAVFVDVWRFEELLREARSAELGGHPGGDPAALLEEAVGLYTADAFGGGASRRWQEEFAMRARHSVLDALGRLARLREGSGDLEGAVAALRRAEQIEPLREDLRRDLMHLLAALGRSDEALACYEHLEAALAERLGLPPSPETRTLHEQIRAGHGRA